MSYMVSNLARGRNRGKEKKNEVIEPHELIGPSELDLIRESLIETHADLVIRGLLDSDVRKRLASIVARDYKHATKGNKEVIAYVVRETIGTGVIEEILMDESITDIGYNGKELIIESNDKKIAFDTSFPITDEYIVRLVNKFANANNRDFTSKNPIFDGRFENVRINAVHSQNTAPESGTTMSLRVVRPKLALTPDNFEGFAPMFMLDYLEAAALTHSNMVISGTTGTGKTELHKLIASYIPFRDRILLIEDTPETFMKEMFPDKDVYSWVTNGEVGVTELIKAGLRNHPVWIMVTETRGSEAYEMIQAVLSGHSIITSLHAVSASAIPSRFVNMAKMGYELSEEALIDDIRRYFNFGIHIIKVEMDGKVVRYLQELREFNPDGDVTVFKQRLVNGVFTFETGVLSDEFKKSMEEMGVTLDFPENFKSERKLNDEHATFKSTIPLDSTGRPDYDKISKMDTTLESLMGRGPVRPVRSKSDDFGDIQVDSDGFITPEVGLSEDTTSSRMLAMKERAKRTIANEDLQADEDVMTPNELTGIEDEVQRIIDNMRNTTDVPEVKPERKPPVPPQFRRARPNARPRVEAPPEPKPKSIEEVMREKRERINREDL